MRGMEPIDISKLLRGILLLIAARSAAWLVYDVVTVLRGRPFMFTLPEASLDLAMIFFSTGACLGIPIAVRVFSWIGRIWGPLSVIGTIGVVVSPRIPVRAWQEIEMGIFACLYTIAGFWLAVLYKRGKRTAQKPAGYAELEVEPPFVKYQRK